MAITLEALEKRVAQLERELVHLQRLVGHLSHEGTPAVYGARLLREAAASQASISAAVAKAYAEMGITGEPVGSTQLRKMMAESGIKAEDNVFSHEIIAMREE
jgi:hypothetical protein